ncbi:MAG: DMT family transporter [Betaproteobacteria bacterium]
MTSASAPPSIYGKLVVVAMLWGGTFVAGRVAAHEMPAPTAALWRYVVACVALLLLSWRLDGGLPRLTRAQWIGVSLLGLTGVATYNLCFMFGLERVPASRGSLIMALNPAMTALGAAFFLHEPLTRNRVLGIVVALFGVTVVLGHGNPLALFTGDMGVGEAALLGCVLAWVTYTLLGKSILMGLSPLAATTYAALTGVIFLAIVAAFSGNLIIPQASTQGWFAIGFLGVFGTAVAFVWFYEGVKTIGPARTAVFINLVPVAAVTLGVLLLGEALEMSMLVGGVLVILGVYVINRPSAPAPAAPVPA